MERNASQNAEITALYRMLALQFREMDIFHNVDDVGNVGKWRDLGILTRGIVIT